MANSAVMRRDFIAAGYIKKSIMEAAGNLAGAGLLNGAAQLLAFAFAYQGRAIEKLKKPATRRKLNG